MTFHTVQSKTDNHRHKGCHEHLISVLDNSTHAALLFHEPFVTFELRSRTRKEYSAPEQESKYLHFFQQKYFRVHKILSSEYVINNMYKF